MKPQINLDKIRQLEKTLNESLENLKEIVARNKGRVLSYQDHLAMNIAESRVTGSLEHLKHSGYPTKKLGELQEKYREIEPQVDRLDIAYIATLLREAVKHGKPIN